MTPLETQLLAAVRSLLDVVEELSQGLAHGQTPEPDWAAVVVATFGEHRDDLLEAVA